MLLISPSRTFILKGQAHLLKFFDCALRFCFLCIIFKVRRSLASLTILPPCLPSCQHLFSIFSAFFIRILVSRTLCFICNRNLRNITNIIRSALVYVRLFAVPGTVRLTLTPVSAIHAPISRIAQSYHPSMRQIPDREPDTPDGCRYSQWCAARPDQSARLPQSQAPRA
jgi:hypothetical protein